MSRAFVREDSEKAEDLPDLPLGPGPYLMTPQGQRRLRERLALVQETLAALKARSERADKHPEAVAERDIRYLEARLKAALVIDPAGQPPGFVAFGARVTVEDENGNLSVFRLVGSDEADPAQGAITVQSPLGAALMGARVGDSVEWRRPAGSLTLSVTAIDFGQDQSAP